MPSYHPQLKVAHVLAYLASRYGGPPRVALALGKEMARLGCELSYYATSKQDEKREFEDSQKKIKLFETTLLKSWYYSPSISKALLNVITNLDIVHIHELWSYPQLVASRLSRRSQTPYIITPHGLLEHWRYNSKGFKKRAYMAAVCRKMLNNSACLHAITPLEVEGFRRIGYKGPVTVIPNGIDPDDFADMPEPRQAQLDWPILKNKRTVLFLSRLSKEKGLDLLIPAWARMKEKNSYDDCVLIIAGPDYRGYANTVQKLVDSYQINDSVLMTGIVTGRRKLSLVSCADIYTLPSYSEGFSISLLENMVAANPVLATTGCNFPEIAEYDAGICVEPDIDQVKTSLEKLLDLSRERRLQMGQNGKTLVLQNYTWSAASKKMLSVYKNIVSGREIPMFPQAEVTG